MAFRKLRVSSRRGAIEVPATLVLHNARVVTVDASRPRAEAGAIGGGRAAGGGGRRAGDGETDLAEQRHPTRWDLDAAAPDHPVRLIHHSGHACVLNSPALRLCSIDITTEEPPGGHLDRDTSSGEPTGLLLEMNDLVDRARAPPAY